MVDDFNDELDLTDEEKQRRLRQPQPIGKMIGPPVAGGAATKAIGQPIMPKKTSPIDYGSIAGAQPTPPDIPQQMPATSDAPATASVGSPIGAPRPQAQALSDWQAQDLAKHPVGQPRYGGIGRVLDAVAGATNVGQAIERTGEIGTLGAQAKQARLAGGAELENKRIEEGQKEQKSGADIQQEETGDELVPVTLPDGTTVQVMRKNVATPTSAIINSASRENIAATNQAGAMDRVNAQQAGATQREGMKETAAQLLQSGKPITMDQLAAKATEEGDQETLAKVQHFKQSIAAAGKSEPGSYVAVNDGAGNTVGWANPKSREWVPASSIASGAVTQAAGGIDGSIPRKPSSIETRTAKNAQYTSDLIDDGVHMVKEAQGELGAINGRWNDFASGKVGLPNAKWTEIAAQMDLIASAARLAHSQGRISPTTLQEVENLLNAGKQDPTNIIAALGTLKKAMTTAQATFGGGVNPAAGGASGGGAGTGAPSTAPQVKQGFGDFARSQGAH